MRTAVVIACIWLGLSGCAQSQDESTVSGGAYAALDDEGSQLREAFNAAKGSVRLVFLVDPVCPGCLRGLDDLDRDLLATTQGRRLQTFVVHVPVIGGGEDDIAPAAELLHNDQVRHYWNPSGGFGRHFAEAVGLRRRGRLVYAWDVWTVYGPDAVWSGASPPRPLRLMHQLQKLDAPDHRSLDSQAFARDVRVLLAELPPTTGRHER